MALLKVICPISVVVMFTYTYGNVIRFNKRMSGNITHLLGEGEGNMVLGNNVLTEDNSVKDDSSFIPIDGSLNLLLNDTNSIDTGSLHHYNQFTSVRHFARHGLCGNDERKHRFYTALRSKLCHTKGTFVLQLVEDLCAEIAGCKNAEKENSESEKSRECGKGMYTWVYELSHLNGDGLVDHFERNYYDYQKDE